MITAHSKRTRPVLQFSKCPSRKARTLYAAFFFLAATLSAAPPESPAGSEPEAAPKRQIPLLATFVKTGVLSDTTALDSPFAFQSFSGAALDDLAVDQMADALRFATGVQIEGTGGTVQRPSFRGTGPRSVLLLVNGRRTAAGYRGLFDFQQISTRFLDRVEVIRGTSSARYGSDAIGGVVNVIHPTTPPGDSPLSAVFRLGGGDFGAAGLQLAGGWANRAAEMFLTAGYRHTDPFSPDGGRNDLVDDTRMRDVLLNGLWRVAPGHQLGYYGNASEFQRRGYRDGNLRDMTTRHRQAALDYAFSPGTGWQASSGLNFSRVKSDLVQPLEAEVHRLWEWNGLLGYTGHDAGNVFFGAEYREESREDAARNQPREIIQHQSFFTQADWEITESLGLTGGLRYDRSDQSGAKVAPRLSAVWKVHPLWRLKAGYAEGFRSPQPFELYVGYFQNRRTQFFRNDPNLKAEKSRSGELVLETEQDWGGAQFSLFRLDLRDRIGSVFVGRGMPGAPNANVFQLVNQQRTRHLGFEGQAYFLLPHRLILSSHLSWLDARDRATGQALPLESEWKAGFGLTARSPAERWRSALHLSHQGKTHDGAGNRLSAFTVINWHNSFRLFPKLSLEAGVSNLFDENSDVFLNRTQPRHFYAGGQWRFQKKGAATGRIKSVSDGSAGFAPHAFSTASGR